MPSIGLCMIIKNEAAIIRRCLDSVLPLLDFALIVDTGSSDGSQQIVRDYLATKNLPGMVVEQPWRNFADNRSQAMQLLRQQSHIDYGLMIDADEILEYHAGFDVARFKSQLTCQLYDIETRYGGIRYQRPQLFSNRLEFSYRGVLHEFLQLPQQVSRDCALGLHNYPLQDSARNQNKRKFLDDAKLLEQAIDQESDPFLLTRYRFYLAQSYRDGGETESALRHYLQRATMGGWQEEVYVSLLNAARLKQSAHYSDADVIQSFMDAHEALPSRLEAVHDAIRFCRLRGKYQQAYLFGKSALEIPPPSSGLFIEPWIAAYGLLDEFSLAAYWAGHYQQAWDALVQLWQAADLPPDYRPRLRENAGFMAGKLGLSNFNRYLT